MNRKTKKGFTLIELIVVIAILAILAIIAIPTVSGMVEKANGAAAAANARTLELAVKATMTSEGAINTSEIADRDDVLTDFGLASEDLTNSNEYSLVVSSDGNVKGYSTSGGGIVWK